MATPDAATMMAEIGRYWRVRYAGGEYRYFAIMDKTDALAQEFANYVVGDRKAGPVFFTALSRRPDGFRGQLSVSFDAISDVEEVSWTEYEAAMGRQLIVGPVDYAEQQLKTPT